MSTSISNIIKEGRLTLRKNYKSLLGTELYLTAEEKKITTSMDAYKIFKQLLSPVEGVQECFAVLALDRSNKVTGYSIISLGGVSSTIVDPKLVFSYLLLQGASAFIVSHNHPSGCLNPSEPDINITKKLKSGGDFVEIRLLDHVIIGDGTDKYLSLADEGKL